MKPHLPPDWEPFNPDDLDATTAFKNFNGATLAEAIELFKSNALCYQEDLESMPKAVFNYYAPAFALYITSESARGDSDGSSSFLHLVLRVVRERHFIDIEVEKKLLNAAAYVAARQTYFNAPESIYGRFTELHSAIRAAASSS